MTVRLHDSRRLERVDDLIHLIGLNDASNQFHDELSFSNLLNMRGLNSMKMLRLGGNRLDD